MKQYFAKSSPRFTNADAQVIGPVLGSLAERGPVTARDVVEAAHSTNSPLHKYFEWDDAKAADLHRIGVAREMVKTVRVRIVSSGDRFPATQHAKVKIKAPEPLARPIRSVAPEATFNNPLSKDASHGLRFAIAAKIEEEASWIGNEFVRDGMLRAAGIVRKFGETPKLEGPKRRFEDHAPMKPELVIGLRDDATAIKDGRTLFPSTVISPKDSPAILVSGENSRKLGSHVTKGPWSGFPIYQLSLEERATCPRECFHWNTCYGNGMQMARRHKNDDTLIPYLRAELTDLQDEFPRGFVVRLHVLGDFFSVEYVAAWRQFLKDFPALHVFGYTAHPKDSEIGKDLLAITEKQFDRFAIRFSASEPQPQGATTIWRMPEDDNVWEGIVCPAQTGKTDCCGSCGLCWAVSAKEKTIAFIAHGRKSKSAGPIEPLAPLTKAQLMGRR